MKGVENIYKHVSEKTGISEDLVKKVMMLIPYSCTMSNLRKTTGLTNVEILSISKVRNDIVKSGEVV